MAPWETDPSLAAVSEFRTDFANVWQTAHKIVFSTTLHVILTSNTLLEQRFDPVSIRKLKLSAPSDLVIGGSTLAAQAFDAGLIDECQLLVYPVLVGEGKSAFLSDTRIHLELLEEHRFENGVVNLRYRVLS